VREGVCPMPHTSVHWSRSSVALAGRTVVSAVPCQIATRGQDVVPAGAAARTRAPHWSGVLSGGLYMQVYAADRVVAQYAGRPESMAPPAKTSGYAASRFAVMPPPADRPVT
jgi:hypothetical protein